MQQMDSVLLPYLQSTDESESERLLNDILYDHAAPLIRHIFKQRLGFHLGQRGTNPHNPDAEDLFQDVLLILIEKLKALHSHPDENLITNFRWYAARVATNACNDHLRLKSQERYRLKHRLRDLMTRHPQFNSWKGANNSIICGLAEWAGQSAKTLDAEFVEKIIETLSDSKPLQQAIRKPNYSTIVDEIFSFLGHPIGIDQLAEIVGGLLKIQDLPIESLSQVEEDRYFSLADTTPRIEIVLEDREQIRQFWEEVRRLSPRERDVICFSFSTNVGDDLFSLLVNAEISTVPELAAEFGLSENQFSEIWKQAPLDNVTLAQHLQTTRQNVSNLRFRAARHLEERLGLERGKLFRSG